ncbi:restriction endonuclease subunit S [Nonomuraea sp. MCN248]|uniref:Restriction endonuclease subunit S n=1 Tax=Nonomuraea corallina TaxID=2989783 RepID=A0ABT4S4M5_9ACTN|nr:restriction endonuclease subunit S [Nonomuraea corallina]MDA0632146.1 restriction endonuclease subunit S [Nonomuraea corallina]
MREHSIGIPTEADWPESILRDLCHLVSRGTAPTYVENSPVLAIGQRCIQNSGFDASNARPHDRRHKRILWAAPGDVLLNSTGTGTIGRSCIFDKSNMFMVDSHVTVIRVDRTKAEPRWINALLRTSWGQRHLESHCYTGSTNQIELSRSELTWMSVPVPPSREQRRIAEILDTLDAQIENQQDVLEKIKAVTTAVITDELTRIVDLADAVLPLVTLASITSGVTLGTETGGSVELPYLRVANVQDGFIDTSEMKNVRVSRADAKRYLLEAGDVLLTEGGDLDKLGRGAVWDARIDPCICQNHVFRVRCDKTRLLPEYLAAYSSSHQGKRYFLSIAKQTTNLASINSTQLKNMPIPLPAIELQKRLIDVASTGAGRIASESDRLQRLKVFRQGLMEDLLTGRVRVPEREAVHESL